jgi:hypothetical protein
MKSAIEKRTGILWGTFRAAAHSRTLLCLILGPADPNRVRFELGVMGRHCYLTWGHR